LAAAFLKTENAAYVRLRAEGRKTLPGDAASFVAIVFAGISLSTEPPKGQSSAAKRFVQETFRIGVPIRKVLSLSNRRTDSKSLVSFYKTKKIKSPMAL
jgi:hypothetical protein